MTVGGTPAVVERPAYQLRLVQALDGDPMVDAACYLFSVESALTGFEVEVRVAPICYHLASHKQRSDMARLAHDLIGQLLAEGTETASSVDVGSDGAARVDGRVFARVFPVRQSS